MIRNIKYLFPRASKDFYDLNIAPELPRPEPQHHKEKSLGEAVPRKEKSMERITVCYTGYRVRPQDPENFAASTKDCTDGLRRCGLLPDDSFWHIRLVTQQEQVATIEEEITKIEITYPNEQLPD